MPTNEDSAVPRAIVVYDEELVASIRLEVVALYMIAQLLLLPIGVGIQAALALPLSLEGGLPVVVELDVVLAGALLAIGGRHGDGLAELLLLELSPREAAHDDGALEVRLHVLAAPLGGLGSLLGVPRPLLRLVGAIVCILRAVVRVLDVALDAAPVGGKEDAEAGADERRRCADGREDRPPRDPSIRHRELQDRRSLAAGARRLAERSADLRPAERCRPWSRGVRCGGRSCDTRRSCGGGA